MTKLKTTRTRVTRLLIATAVMLMLALAPFAPPAHAGACVTAGSSNCGGG